jgi:lysine-N-methylase
MNLPEGPLRSLVEVAMVRSTGEDKTAACFATIGMLPSGACPFLSAEHLCGIQAEHGEGYLCRICAEFPRVSHTIDGLKETVLTLSCPEAARTVLLEPQLLPQEGGPGYTLTWDEAAPEQTELRTCFWPIREFVLRLIVDRRYALWQRMFLLGTFSRRLGPAARGVPGQGVPELLSDFRRAIEAGGLSTAMDAIPADLPLQLEMVLRLVDLRVNHASLTPRLRTVLQMFAEGVGHSRGAPIEGQAARYREAYEGYYYPFFRRQPHILENYLINAILGDLFPFQQALGDRHIEPEPARAFAVLAIQFALIKGLLIGVAGARRQEFCDADVVRTVQAAAKHFEHNRQFLPKAHDLLAAKGLDDARGLTMLLRN